MKILLCSPQEISHSMGISRVLIELKKELIRKGHQCELIGPKEIGCTLPYSTQIHYLKHYAILLKEYIHVYGEKFDIIDVDHEFFPFDRSEFSQKYKIIARTVLLVQHLDHIKFPRKLNFRYYLGQILKHYSRSREQYYRINVANKTFQNADLINVPNNKDKELLIKLGLNPEKIVVIPYGLSPERIELFKNTVSKVPLPPKICFVGTFDYRKGAMHFSDFLDKVAGSIPDVTLKLVGCKGMFQNENEILAFFPKHLHSKLEIVLKFERDQIVEQLKDCGVGIYPSYVEGFPFGILEMMMSNIPVIAFDAPGAGMMVPEEFLIPVADSTMMASKTINLLKNENLLELKRKEAKKQVEKFTWEEVADQTVNAYKKLLNTSA